MHTPDTRTPHHWTVVTWIDGATRPLSVRDYTTETDARTAEKHTREIIARNGWGVRVRASAVFILT